MNMEIQKIIELEIEILKSQKENVRKQADARTYESEYVWALNQVKDGSTFDKELLLEYKTRQINAILDSKKLTRKIEILESQRNSLQTMILDKTISEEEAMG